MTSQYREASNIIFEQCVSFGRLVSQLALYQVCMVQKVLQILVHVLQTDFSQMSSVQPTAKKKVDVATASGDKITIREDKGDHVPVIPSQMCYDNTLRIDDAIEKYAVIATPKPSAWLATNTVASKVEQQLSQKIGKVQIESFVFPQCSLRPIEGVINVTVDLRTLVAGLGGDPKFMTETALMNEGLKLIGELLVDARVAKRAFVRTKCPPLMLVFFSDALSDGRGVLRYDLYVNNVIPSRLHTTRSEIVTRFANGTKFFSWVERWWFERTCKGLPRDTDGTYYMMRYVIHILADHFLRTDTSMFSKASASHLFKRFIRYYALRGWRSGNAKSSEIPKIMDSIQPCFDVVEEFGSQQFDRFTAECVRAQRIVESTRTRLSHLVRRSHKEMSLLEALLL
eukprot:TRINITY_DN5003_c0_g2_i1.p1 TRINITY_DN5003_c0_g2~~TRINITY_DN5003_c0_g2_i1.p1  ORF type:complete len:423 (-),score=50.85 TRINITY_DN5003_c0_g2_i1:358-1551(-)